MSYWDSSKHWKPFSGNYSGSSDYTFIADIECRKTNCAKFKFIFNCHDEERKFRRIAFRYLREHLEKNCPVCTYHKRIGVDVHTPNERFHFVFCNIPVKGKDEEGNEIETTVDLFVDRQSFFPEKIKSKTAGAIPLRFELFNIDDSIIEKAEKLKDIIVNSLSQDSCILKTPWGTFSSPGIPIGERREKQLVAEGLPVKKLLTLLSNSNNTDLYDIIYKKSTEYYVVKTNKSDSKIDVKISRESKSPMAISVHDSFEPTEEDINYILQVAANLSDLDEDLDEDHFPGFTNRINNLKRFVTKGTKGVENLTWQVCAYFTLNVKSGTRNDTLKLYEEVKPAIEEYFRGSEFKKSA